MTVTSNFWDPFSVSVDGVSQVERMEGQGEKGSFGYSKNGTSQPNTCDDYAVCDRNLRPGTPERMLFNLITRFSGVVSYILNIILFQCV